eukprot:563512-Amphidinium_carterae.1
MKLNIWNLTEWDRVIAFDADMLIQYPLDHVFEMFPEVKIAAVPRSPLHPHVSKTGYFKFNGGLLLVQPDVAIFSQLKGAVGKLKDCDMNVEQPFYEKFGKEFLGAVGKLPPIYNCHRMEAAVCGLNNKEMPHDFCGLWAHVFLVLPGLNDSNAFGVDFRVAVTMTLQNDCASAKGAFFPQFRSITRCCAFS